MNKQDSGEESKVDYSLIERQEAGQGEASLQYKIQVYQRVIREWSGSLSIHEFAVVMQIIDRTVGWGERRVTVSTGSIRYGGGLYTGLNISRRQLFNVLSSLEEKKVIRRTKNRGGASRISINIGWTPTMLNVPKRLQNKTKIDEKDPCTTRTNPCTTCTNPCTGCTLYTDNLYTDNLLTGTATPNGGGYNGKNENSFPEKIKPPTPQSPPSQKVRAKVEQATADNRAAQTAKLNRTKGRTDVSTGIEATWQVALQETFEGVSHVPWNPRHKRQIKDVAKKWVFGSQVSFDDLVDWSVRNWSRIMRKEFSWMTKKKPPATPEIGFFLNFRNEFANQWASKELDEWLNKEERTKVEKWMVGGMTREEALNELAMETASINMKRENRKTLEKAGQKLRMARAALKQSVEVADRRNAPARRTERPVQPLTPVTREYDPKKVDFSGFPVLDPKNNPYY